jgi:multiple sugar transport system permease protein
MTMDNMNFARLSRKAYKSVPFYVLLVVIFVFLLFPFYWGAITSFKFQTELYDFTGNFLFIKNPSLSNYTTLFGTPDFFKWFWNTFSISILTTLISVAISVAAGFAIGRMKFRGVAIAGTMVFIVYLIPRTFLFIPLAQILKDWGLLGQWQSLLLTYPTFLVPFCTWLLSGYFSNVPREPEECAMIDGASRIGAIMRITLPMALPGILTAAIFSFTASWNELLYPIVFVNGATNNMLTSGVLTAFQNGDQYYYGPLMAAATVASLPIALMYIFFTDRFVSGISAGATKG